LLIEKDTSRKKWWERQETGNKKRGIPKTLMTQKVGKKGERRGEGWSCVGAEHVKDKRKRRDPEKARKTSLRRNSGKKKSNPEAKNRKNWGREKMEGWRRRRKRSERKTR